MSKKRIPSQYSILTQIAEEDNPTSEIDLRPDLQKALDKENITGRRGFSSSPSHVAKRRQWQLLTGSVFLLVLSILLITSPGQALAQQILEFFAPAKETSYPAPIAVLTVNAQDGQAESPLDQTATPLYASACTQTDQRQRYACVLALTQQKISFPLKALPADTPLELAGIDIDLADKAVSLYYGSNATIVLIQRRSPFPHSIRKADDTLLMNME
jgi:hypothetical protein